MKHIPLQGRIGLGSQGLVPWVFFCFFSGAPWVRKFGYLCFQEILVLTKSCVRRYVRPFVHPFV